MEHCGRDPNHNPGAGKDPPSAEVVNFGMACLSGRTAEVFRSPLTDPDQVWDTRNTGLTSAAQRGHMEICRHLVEDRGADVELGTANLGWRPLHWAVSYDRDELAAFLVQRLGADVNGTNHHGVTPLHRARGDRLPRMLVSTLGADPNARDLAGLPPLMAWQRPQPASLEALVQGGWEAGWEVDLNPAVEPAEGPPAAGPPGQEEGEVPPCNATTLRWLAARGFNVE